MFRTMQNWLGRRTRNPNSAKAIRTARLRVHQLEDRFMPVVGAFAIPDAIAAGAGFDGVVSVSNAQGSGSGSLLSTGRHILTAGNGSDAITVAAAPTGSVVDERIG